MSDTDPTKAELKDRIERLESENERLRNEQETEDSGVSRRSILSHAAAIAGAGAISLTAATGSAAAAPAGTFPASTEPALLRLRVDRLRYIPRSSDPSSPNGGTTWVVK